MADARVLILNAGSSSIKFAVFDSAFEEQVQGLADGIGGASRLIVDGAETEIPFIDHKAALSGILNALADRGITAGSLTAIGHRVVHGGRNLTAPTRITPEVRAEITDCTPLAPLHNPHSLAAIDPMGELAPDLPQFARFDTSFHAPNPHGATRYALPRIIAHKRRRRHAVQAHT